MEAGLSNTGDDEEVGMDVLKTAQREINGHVSMLIKIFKIGKNWLQGDRIRETMMGESMETCPVHLLYKDHKGWTPSKGGVPPTRHVAGGNRGVNLYLSEIVSDILEPMVGMVIGGHEVISTEDMIANVVDMNHTQVDWLQQVGGKGGPMGNTTLAVSVVGRTIFGAGSNLYFVLADSMRTKEM